MEVSKQYLHDKFVLLLISVSVLMAFMCVALILLRLDISQGVDGYIVSYRANLGLGAFQRGSIVEIFGFALFGIIVAAFNIILSMRTYHLRRSLSLTVLSAGLLVLVLALIVSNALLTVN